MGGDVFYFGCRGEAGHFFHCKTWWKQTLTPPDGFPWGLAVDGGLQPPVEREPRGHYSGHGFEQGEAVRHVRDGWTAVAYWDRSVDKRYASCSVLIVHDVLTTEQVVERVRAVMPDVLRVPIREIAFVEG